MLSKDQTLNCINTLITIADQFSTIARIMSEAVETTPATPATPATPGASEHTDPHNTAPVELDADMMPWDSRINGASKLKLKKEGTWKLIKGVDKSIVSSVRSELRLSYPATTAPAPTPVPATTTPAPAPAPVPATTAPAPAPTPATTAPSVKYLVNDNEFTAEQLRAAGWSETDIARADQAPTIVPSPGITTFPALMQQITPAIAAGTLTDAQVVAACNRQNITSLVLVASRPDLIPAIHAELFPNG